MHINVFADASLRVVMLLAVRERRVDTAGSDASPRDGGTGVVVRELTSRQIAEAVGIPYNHVSKAISKLRQLGIVRTERGRSGGVCLDALGWTVTVGALLRELDGDENPAACFRAGNPCPLLRGCALRHALLEAREQFYRALDECVVADLSHSSQMLPVLQPPSL